MRLALDAMGGDHAPAAAVEGALAHARRSPSDTVVLVGDERRIQAELDRLGKKAKGAKLAGGSRPLIHHAADAIGVEEQATVVRRRPQSSIRVCFELLQQGRVDAVVSAGNSGAVMTAAMMTLGKLPDVERPAIAAALPTLTGGYTLLLDCGANVSCRASHLVQFGHLGEAYARKVLGIPRPKVALLSNGEEPSKGTEITRAAFRILERSGLAFTGYVEGRDLFAGTVDVVVTDGFTGNVALKTSEGAAAALGAMLKREIENHTTAKLGAMLMTSAFAAFKRIVDYAEYGGAPLLGVAGVGIVAHGRSTPRAFANALRTASEAASINLAGELAQAAAAAKRLSDQLDDDVQAGGEA